jgi:hypothetical protein
MPRRKYVEINSTQRLQGHAVKPNDPAHLMMMMMMIMTIRISIITVCSRELQVQNEILLNILPVVFMGMKIGPSPSGKNI